MGRQLFLAFLGLVVFEPWNVIPHSCHEPQMFVMAPTVHAEEYIEALVSTGVYPNIGNSMEVKCRVQASLRLMSMAKLRQYSCSYYIKRSILQVYQPIRYSLQYLNIGARGVVKPRGIHNNNVGLKLWNPDPYTRNVACSKDVVPDTNIAFSPIQKCMDEGAFAHSSFTKYSNEIRSSIMWGNKC